MEKRGCIVTSGKYLPFTKSVEICRPEPDDRYVKDICNCRTYEKLKGDKRSRPTNYQNLLTGAPVDRFSNKTNNDKTIINKTNERYENRTAERYENTRYENKTIENKYENLVANSCSSLGNNNATNINFTENLRDLNTCGFYYKNLNSEDARQLLQSEVPGTFLIRDSSSPSSYFTLSFVNQEFEVKHLRVIYSFGNFHFHSSDAKKSKKISRTVLGLVEMYLSDTNSECAERDNRILKTPFRKKMLTLKELCRVRINRGNFPINDKTLQNYVSAYRYKI